MTGLGLSQCTNSQEGQACLTLPPIGMAFNLVAQSGQLFKTFCLELERLSEQLKKLYQVILRKYL